MREDRRYCSTSIRKSILGAAGGAEPALLAEAAAIGEGFGYDEINLNVGCPSDRVQQATFGACLMARPRLVADCVRAMQAAVGIPVTVKCRIGIDDRDDWEFLREFVAAVGDAGCQTVIVHARKAILKGLTPKENREVPPLDYARAWRVKQEFPMLTIVANGGLRTVPQVTEQLAHVDGVMLAARPITILLSFPHPPRCMTMDSRRRRSNTWPEHALMESRVAAGTPRFGTRAHARCSPHRAQPGGAHRRG